MRRAPNTAFIDTSYLIALINPRDKYHLTALRVTEALAESRTLLITTEVILIEALDGLAQLATRRLALRLMHEFEDNSEIDIIPLKTSLLERAIALYLDRMDKEWGLTDCISFVVMQQRGIISALTTDHHFEQAGFQVLL
jgi:hypothetical protein